MTTWLFLRNKEGNGFVEHSYAAEGVVTNKSSYIVLLQARFLE